MTIKERIEYAETKRDEAIKNDWDSDTISYWRGYIDGLKAIAKADVVEVVRCKDCMYWTGKDYDGCCIKNGLATRYAKDYCNYGERRANDG